MKKINKFCIAIVLLLVGWVALASSHDKVITAQQAIHAAMEYVDGKVLSAKRIPGRGPAVYRIKMITKQGKVRVVFVDGVDAHIIQVN